MSVGYTECPSIFRQSSKFVKYQWQSLWLTVLLNNSKLPDNIQQIAGIHGKSITNWLIAIPVLMQIHKTSTTNTKQ